jgi:hypothetical protein
LPSLKEVSTFNFELIENMRAIVMKPNLDSVKKKIQENRDLVDRIIATFPGFKGYVEGAESHDADKMIRNLIVDGIQKFKNDINAKSSELAKKGEHAILSDLESLNIRLETLYKKCKHAEYGSFSSTSRMKASDEDRNRLLEYDWRLISDIDDLEKMIGEITTASSDALNVMIQNCGNKLKEFEKNFDERKNVLLEVL